MAGRIASYEPLRAAGALLIAWYISAYLRRPQPYLLLDHVDLTIHEAGHVLFAFLGDTVSIAGGTILQIIVPIAFVIHFARRQQGYSAAIVVFWVAQSLFNVAVYAADARAQVLPLVGGENVIHDWNYLLGSAGWLHHDITIAAGVRGLAVLTWLVALIGSLWFARRFDPAGVGATIPVAGWSH